MFHSLSILLYIKTETVIHHKYFYQLSMSWEERKRKHEARVRLSGRVLAAGVCEALNSISSTGEKKELFEKAKKKKLKLKTNLASEQIKD